MSTGTMEEQQMDDVLDTLVKFLKTHDRLDLKGTALQHLLDLTGTEDGRGLIAKNQEIVRSVVVLMKDKCQPIRKDACFTFINLSAQANAAKSLVNLEQPSLIQCLIDIILDEDSHEADPCCMVLSNLTRPPDCCRRVWEKMEDSLEKLLIAFCTKGYNKHQAKLHYIGPVLSNLSQLSEVRRILLNTEKVLIQRLLPFTEFTDSEIRRGGIVGTLRNCCFHTESHSWLLGEEVDILPHLLLPLAGGENFSEEENDKLPLDLQYLPEDKERESDPDIRKMLLESLLQLCSLTSSRVLMRDKGVYYILRELHKWEQDTQVKLCCEDIVNILIRTEEEIGEDDLKRVELPERIQKKFEEIDLKTE